MMQVLQPPEWVRPRGYSNGVAARGTLVFTSGQLGWDAQEKFSTTDYMAQVEQALKNVVAVLRQGGARPEHIVRLTWYVTDKETYLASLKELGNIFRELIGSYNATMTAFEVKSLMVEKAKVQIEAIAVIPD